MLFELQYRQSSSVALQKGGPWFDFWVCMFSLCPLWLHTIQKHAV